MSSDITEKMSKEIEYQKSKSPEEGTLVTIYDQNCLLLKILEENELYR